MCNRSGWTLQPDRRPGRSVDHSTTVVPVSTTPPVRIVSLLPSATEILFALGLDDHVVGVTFECDHPARARTKRIVSNTTLPDGLTPAEIDAFVKERIAAGEDLYRLERGALTELRPDLVVTQDLCQVCAVATTSVDEALQALGIESEVLTLDPSTLDEVLQSIVEAGSATDREWQAAALVAALRARLDELTARSAASPTRSVVVLEWTDPPFASGHWVPDLVTAAGGRDLLGRAGERSIEVSWDEVRAAPAEVVIIAPCGYGLDGAAQLGAKVLAARSFGVDTEVWAVDADGLVVRPGPRLVDGAELFASILHPELFGPPDSTRAQRLV